MNNTTTELPTGHTLTDAKQIMLLAAAEESYSQCASVLQPALVVLTNMPNQMLPLRERLETGLHLLEEAMRRHNHYMESLE